MFNRIKDDDIDGFVCKPLFLTMPIFVEAQKGDSLHSLAAHFGLPIAKLRAVNAEVYGRNGTQGLSSNDHLEFSEGFKVYLF